MATRALTFALVVLLAAATVGAQTRPATRPPTRSSTTPTERGFLSVNGIFQAGPGDFSDAVTIRVNAENGRLETDYALGSGPAFDVSGGAIVWRNLGVGIGVTRFSTSTTTSINASVPHPFFFNQPRTVTGDVTGTRQELAVHVQVRGVFVVNRRVQVSVFGGPSFFQVDQDIVSSFDYTEAYPFDTATFSQAVASTQSESAVGVNVGVDVAYFFSRVVGVGGGMQYSGATVQMAFPSGSADVKAGGAQFGGGLRLRF